jgi:cellulose synthase (UDP-forming)
LDVLQSDGSTPIRFFFHIPPDLYYGEEQNVAMRLRYRYNALPVAAGSALRVFINGALVNEVMLPSGKGLMEGLRTILVPIAIIRPFGNTAVFNFDFIPANQQTAQDPASTPLKGEIRCNSSLDLHRLALWTNMPNLELFANAGFPFTSLADLAETTVVLPAVPSPAEIALYLYLMGHFGAQTGYPVLRVAVDGPNAVLMSGRNYLVLGSLADQPAFNALDPLLPVAFDSNGVHVKPETGYLANASSIYAAMTHWLARLLGRSVWRDLPSNIVGMPDAMIEEIRAPSSLNSSIVLIVLGQDSAAENFASVFLDRSQSTDISGSVSLLRDSAFHSYALDGDVYHVGNISRYAVVRIWLTHNFLLLLFVVTALSFLVAYWAYGWLKWHAHERLKLAETQDKSK